MPVYEFKCKKCKKEFEEICQFSDVDTGFKNVSCPKCKSKKIEQAFLTPPAAVFSDVKSSSKWDNWSYRQGQTMEKAKMERAAAEAAAGGEKAYKDIDDTNNGRRMNFID